MLGECLQGVLGGASCPGASPPRPPPATPWRSCVCSSSCPSRVSAQHRGSSVKGTFLCCCTWCCTCPLSSQTLVSVRADSGFLCAQGCAWVLFSFALGLGVSWWGGSFQCDVSRRFPVRLSRSSLYLPVCWRVSPAPAKTATRLPSWFCRCDFQC